jgi:hypothetical protein
MPVEVARQAGTGNPALIQADVITLRVEHPVEDRSHAPYDQDRFGQVLALKFAQRPPVEAGGDEEMAIIIGISVEHDDRVLAAEHEEVLAILVRGEPAAEEASVRRLRRNGTLMDVLRAPGGPELIPHDARSPDDGRTRPGQTELRSWRETHDLLSTGNPIG